jgi:RNA polymerase sigma-70 factor, ECF subfamily
MELAMMDELKQPGTIDIADPDLPLVDASASGDMAAFDELVRRHDQKLLRIARQVTRNLEDAQDVVQETFLKAFEKLHQFQRNSKFSTWLIRIAINQALMKVRKMRYAQELPLEYEGSDGESLPVDLTDWSPDPELLYSRSELHEILHNALEKLSPSLRIVFILRDVEGMSLPESAAVLHLHPSAVKARLYRARLQLREFLSKYFRQPIHDAQYLS